MYSSTANGVKKSLMSMVLVLAVFLSLIAIFAPSQAFATDEEAIDASTAEAGGLTVVSGTVTGLNKLPAGDALLRFVSLDTGRVVGNLQILDRKRSTFNANTLDPGRLALRLEIVDANGIAVSTQFLSVDGKQAVTVKRGEWLTVTAEAVATTAKVSGSVAFSGYNSGTQGTRYIQLLQLVEGVWLIQREVRLDSGVKSVTATGFARGSYKARFSAEDPCNVPMAMTSEGSAALPNYDVERGICPFPIEWWPGQSSLGNSGVFDLAMGQHVQNIDGTLNSNHLDIQPGRKFASDVLWMYTQRISTGTNGAVGNFYEPSLSVTREAMAAFIYRYAGRPAFTPPATPSFADVPTTAKFYKEIEWMKSNKLTTGIKAGGKLNYAPKSSISREAMAAFLYRLAGKPEVFEASVKTFRDVPSTQKFAKEITWMSGAGITTGWKAPQGLEFQPLSPVKRDAMAAFLHRFDGVKNLER